MFVAVFAGVYSTHSEPSVDTMFSFNAHDFNNGANSGGVSGSPEPLALTTIVALTFLLI